MNTHDTTEDSTNALLIDIINWINQRSTWQRNIFKRLAREEEIPDSYIAQIAKQLTDGKQIDLEQPEVSITDLTESSGEFDSPKLASIGNLKAINALPGDQTLTFEQSGITIIYGDNGSGKSGYARILKRISGAQHQEEILTNVFENSAETQSAEVTYLDNDQQFTEVWTQNHKIGRLKQIHFYDEACGNHYLQKETELTYRPSALTLLDDFAKQIERVSNEFEELIKVEQAKTFALPETTTGTKANLLLSSLSLNTSPSAITALLNEHPNLEAELQGLTQREAQLATSNPTKEKLALQSVARAAESLLTHIKHIQANVNAETLKEIAFLKKRALELRNSANTEGIVSDTQLPGVGSTTWRALWNAAREYSLSEAYPDTEFPPSREGDYCLLCQQPLNVEARDRLDRFERYITSRLEKEAQAAENDFEEARVKLIECETNPPDLQAWLSAIPEDAELNTDRIKQDISDTHHAQSQMITSLTSSNEHTRIDYPTFDTLAIEKLFHEYESRADKLDLTSFQAELEEVKKKKAEREDLLRIKLAEQQVIDYIQHLQYLHLLETKQGEAATKPITLQINRLARTYVTETISEYFVTKAREMRLFQVTLSEPKGRKGSLFQQPTLRSTDGDSPTSKASTMSVLSEGEQTAAGLAGFLTEVYFDHSKSCVIFDDPMSSLDHQRRASVAQNIVNLAEDRQVIVFTHDVVFLSDVVKRADFCGIPICERSVERDAQQRPGQIINDFPWKAKRVTDRIQELNSLLASIKRDRSELSRSDYENRTSDWAGKLSETWERLIRSEIIYRVVDRSTTEVRPMMVRILAKITDDDYNEFLAGYSAASTWARRHDKSEEVSYVAPEPDQMKSEIDRLAATEKRIHKYAQQK